MKEVDVLGVQLPPTGGSPVVLLVEHDLPNRLVPVAIGSAEATAIALANHDVPMSRPLTHDLLATLVSELGASVVAAEVHDERNGTFLARLVVRREGVEVQVDARPSDAIAVALRAGAPLFVSDGVLERSGLVAGPPDDAAVDAEVDQFRAFLDEVEPDAFGGPPSPPDHSVDRDGAP